MSNSTQWLAIIFLWASSATFAAGQDFDELTALANGALLGQHVEEAVPGFEIQLMREGEVLYHHAFGDWSLDRVAEANSSTKNVTGAVMMSIAQSGEGNFSLDSRLSDFLPSFDQPSYRDITIRQAFSHSSGLGALDFTGILENDSITLQQAAEQISQKPLVNGPPGSQFSYGGLSMQAAGAAAEVATGQSFVDLLAERITGPLEMENTRFVIASASNPRIAGGLESTASDFSRFMDMVMNDGVDRATGTRLLSESSVAEMLTRQTSELQPVNYSPAGNNRYGIGVWLDQLDQAGPAVDVLAGGAKGFHSWIDKEHDLVFTFATDQTSFANVELLSSMMHESILTDLYAAGDYDLDGDVDGADFFVWQLSNSLTGANLPADGNADGTVDAADYLVWRNNYGTGPLISALQVPEPASILLLFLAAASCNRRRCPQRC
ncbi:serine hydrolase [Adhaeretor mobilis]|uniref:D-alanyl-D-alanine carboxypeptidase n=1 Tax=Adhaeretor mobilis TaxID=1930276 RepID=A0A517MQ63_9BACT|nr:serine hydrolase [Adhaeretor mobilis]QDS97019.1 D-alanyl-D-alanine carboxypeptidase precursor [Adhaeretor mobilis]